MTGNETVVDVCGRMVRLSNGRTYDVGTREAADECRHLWFSAHPIDSALELFEKFVTVFPVSEVRA